MQVLLRMWMACALVALAGCSGSSVRMLEKGDAAVCANDDVTGDVFDIIRQHSAVPGGRDLLDDYDEAHARLLAEIDLHADQITSTDVDPANRRVACNAQVTITARQEDRRRVSIDYAVTADLANQRPIVTADPSEAVSALNTVLAHIGEPLIEAARNRRKADDERRTDRYERAWVAANPSDVAEIRADILREVPRGRFGPAELGMIMRERLIARQCNSTTGDEEKLLCDRSRSMAATIGGSFCRSYDRLRHCGSVEEERADYEAFTGRSPDAAEMPTDRLDASDENMAALQPADTSQSPHRVS